jgi:cell division protein FtsB
VIRRALWPLAAVVALAVGLFLFGYPTRTYLEQRASLAREQAVVTKLSASNAALRTQAARLQTPAEIQRIARQEYDLVQPGQEEYAILPAPVKAGRQVSRWAAPGPVASSVAPSGSDPTAPTHATSRTGVWGRLLRQLEFWR